MPGIGLLNEKPLHALLKKWYTQPGDQFEVAVNEYVVDIVRGDRLLEIQTGNSPPSKQNRKAKRHTETANFAASEEDLILLEDVRELHG